MAQPNRKIGYDPEKLNGMAEPLRVRLEKMRGGRTPVWLPGRTDTDADGSGYARDDVPVLEAMVPFWSGSGSYECVITDASGTVTMKWPMMYQDDLQNYPPHRVVAMNEVRSFDELVARCAAVQQTKPWLVPGGAPPMPAGMPGAATPRPMPQMQQPRAQIPSPMAQAPWWPQPQVDPWAAWQQQQAQQGYGGFGGYPQGYPGYSQPFAQQFPQMPGYPGMFPAPPAASVESEALKIKIVDLEHARARDAERLEAQTRQKSLEDEIRKLSELVNQKRHDPEDERRREDARRAEEDRRREEERRREDERRREAEDRRRELEEIKRQHTESMARMEDRVREQNAAMQQTTQLNSVITAMQTAMTNQSTFAQQLTGMQRESNDKALEFVKNQPNGAEAMMRQAESLFSLQGRAVEMLLNIQQQTAQPGEHPVKQIADNVLDKASVIFGRWFKKGETEANAQANIAAARAAEAQANASAVGGLGGFAPPPPVVQQESGMHNGGLNGAEGIPIVEVPVEQAPNGAANGNGTGNVRASAEAQREIELWGNAREEVAQLRALVYAGKISPEICANALFQAADEIVKRKEMIPAFKLWNEAKFDELVELLIPKIASSYQQEVVALIVQEMGERAKLEVDDVEDEGDEEDDGGDVDVVAPVVAAAAPPPIAEVKKAMSIQSAVKPTGKKTAVG